MQFYDSGNQQIIVIGFHPDLIGSGILAGFTDGGLIYPSFKVDSYGAYIQGEIGANSGHIGYWNIDSRGISTSGIRLVGSASSISPYIGIGT